MTTHNQTIAWDDRQLDLLYKLWTSGMSASRIGEQLGVTRNAVIGKVHRLGITRLSSLHPSSRTRKAESVHYARADKLLRRAAEVKPASRRGRHRAGNKTFEQLKPRDCRWPLGGPLAPATFFCGGEAVFGRPYCCEHCRIGGARYRGRR